MEIIFYKPIFVYVMCKIKTAKLKYFITIIAMMSNLIVTAQRSKPDKNLFLMLDDFAVMFEGEFDNYTQYYKEQEDSVQYPHDRVHSIFKRVDIPAFGPYVFYVLQYADGDSTAIYRQRIYHFSPDEKENAIRLSIYSFIADSLYYYAHHQPIKLKDLSPELMKHTKGCDVWWKKQGDAFIGYMKPEACKIVSRRTGKTIYITDSLRLTKDEIWINDQAKDSVGNYVFGNLSGIPTKLKKCTFYSGWMALQKAGVDESMGMYKLRFHDQGSRIRFFTEDNQATRYEIELATVIYGKNLNVLKLAIYEDGKSKAVAYTWASPGSENIGINLRWISAGLTKIK